MVTARDRMMTLLALRRGSARPVAGADAHRGAEAVAGVGGVVLQFGLTVSDLRVILILTDVVIPKRNRPMRNVNILQIPQDILDSSRLSVSELKVELAVYLYVQRRLSIGKARELADMSLWEFRQLLASRRISPHYDETDLDEDMATLREIGRL
jgi:predicted HTH domain antitoxin